MKLNLGPKDEGELSAKDEATLRANEKHHSDVLRALEEYVTAVEAGDAPDRKALLEKYPAAAKELAACLNNMDFIDCVAPQLTERGNSPSASGTPLITALATVGDYRILREIGRGGMGVVYEAKQTSIGRRVALKVLPFAAMLDKQQLNRFKNEVRAAGTLDHPNIVSVYSVGTDRGIHYYAMQLVDGQSVAELISDLAESQGTSPAGRDNGQTVTFAANGRKPGLDDGAQPRPEHLPSEPGVHPSADTKRNAQASISTVPKFDSQEYFRGVARMGMQAAQALDHAHQNGIVHRDIKPGNLLIDTDGKLWVTDFGLARIEADAGMTMTGDVLGTLRYMSPEQARGKQSVVDHRTDIYSLGVTLFELLTLQRLYGGVDRQEILRRITSDEPRRLRHINRRIPEDLETIISKAIENCPEDRYSTAKELCDDLERYLSARPIHARPPNLRQRVSKWSRRNPIVVASSAAVLAVLLIASLISSMIVAGAWGDAREAQVQTALQRDQFMSARDQALRNLYLSDIRLARQEWENADLMSFDRLLDRHVPLDNQPDNRGWEWYYLKSLDTSGVETLKGHRSDVKAVAWSPDGRFLASGSADTSVKIWNASTGQVHATLHGHTKTVQFIAWSPDGKQLASSAVDHTIRIWDFTTENSVLTIDVGWLTRQVSWSPDGSKLVSGGDSYLDRLQAKLSDAGEGDRFDPSAKQALIKVWDARTGAELLQMKYAADLAWSVVWSPDGKLLASSTNYETARVLIWDAETGDLIHEIAEFTVGQPVNSVTWSPDGRRLATAHRESVQVWDTADWGCQWRATAHPGGANWVDWSPSGDLLASVGHDGTLKIWNADGEMTNTLRGHRSSVGRVDWRLGGERVATASNDGTIRIWDKDWQQSANSIRSFASSARWFNSDERTIALLSEGDKQDSLQLQLLSGSRWESRQNYPLSLKKSDFADHDSRMAWSPDQSLFAIARTKENTLIVSVVELATGAIVNTVEQSFEGRLTLNALAWHPVASLVAIAINGQGACVWDTSSGKFREIYTAGATDIVDSLRWSPDGSYLAVSMWTQDLIIFDARNWREVVCLDRHPGLNHNVVAGEHMVAWSPDGTVLAAGTSRGWVVQWDTSTWREKLSIPAHTTSVEAIAISGDGRRLVTAGKDGTVKMWDADDGTHLMTFERRAQRLAWSDDGTCLLGSWDGHHWVMDASEAMSN